MLQTRHDQYRSLPAALSQTGFRLHILQQITQFRPRRDADRLSLFSFLQSSHPNEIPPFALTSVINRYSCSFKADCKRAFADAAGRAGGSKWNPARDVPVGNQLMLLDQLSLASTKSLKVEFEECVLKAVFFFQK